MKRFKPNVIYVALLVVVCLFMSGAIYSVYRLSQSPRLIPHGPLGEGLGAVLQLESEVVDLLHLLARFNDETANMSADRISLQLDVVWSRKMILDSGAVHLFISTIPGYVDTLQIVQSTLEAVDPLMAQIQAGDPEAANAMYTQLAPLQQPLHMLSVEVVHWHVATLATTAVQTRQLLSNTMMFLIIALLSGSIISVLLMWQIRTVTREVAVRRAAERAAEERTVELRVANEELAATTRAKDEFLAGMSHELRTPLNAIMGLSEIMQKERSLSDKQRRHLRIIHESGQHLLALISDILDIARVGAGELQLVFEAVSVEAVCQAALQLIKPVADKKHQYITTRMDNTAHTIRADKRRLTQILVNLLSNAVKFTPARGHIGLEVERDADAGVVRFIVWDNGIGIAKEAMTRLFEPFVQLDSGLSRQYSGSGLGLSLVYHMAELHGGSVSVESTVGKGSRFTVFLPWSAVAQDEKTPMVIDAGEQATSAQVSEDASATSKRPLILVTEDNEAYALILAEYLQTEGYQVIVAGDGSEAIQCVRDRHPDLILMDIQMPGMDGLEAIHRLRNEEKLTIPIIALTALAMPGDRERCLAAGADAYLSKPVNMQYLLTFIGSQFVKTTFHATPSPFPM